MRNKLINEELVSYSSLGKYVRQKRKNLGYNSAEKFADATKVDPTYVKRIETGDGTFGSPERFVGLARALGVTPGFLMDIFAEVIDFSGNPIQTTNIITLPENFTMEDKKLLGEIISFLGYRKQFGVKLPKTIADIPAPPLTPEETQEVLEVDTIHEQSLPQPQNKPIENELKNEDNDA